MDSLYPNMKRTRGRPYGPDGKWPNRLGTLLKAVDTIQKRKYTVSTQELGEALGLSRMTVTNWLKVAEGMGYVDLHGSVGRALQLLPAGRKIAQRKGVRL